MEEIKNKAKKIGKLEVSHAELKTIMLIFVIPLIAVCIDTFQMYIVTQIWDWTQIMNVVAWVVAPAGLGWLKSKYDTEKADMKKSYENEIQTLKDEKQALTISTELQKQEIAFLNKYATKKE
jgi:hypothetical protein